MRSSNTTPSHHHHHQPRPASGTTQACAACKYQRRKCAPDCILAPYFPHDKQRQFLNAHKLFGVSNITKIIKNLNQSAKDEAMSTIIFQSDVRASDPVGGCYRIIHELQRQIEYNKAELDIVLHQLAICRSQHPQVQVQVQVQAQAQAQAQTCEIMNNVVVDPLGTYNDAIDHYQYVQPQQQHQQQQQQQYVADQSESSNLVQDFHGWGLQDSVSSSSCCEPLLEISGDHRNDHQFKFDAEEIVYRRDEGILRAESALLKEEADSIKQAQDHDLKSAATLFALTNCNS